MPPFPLRLGSQSRSTYGIQSENSSFSVSSLSMLCSLGKNHQTVESIKRMCVECTVRPTRKGCYRKGLSGCKLLTALGGAHSTQEMS